MEIEYPSVHGGSAFDKNLLEMLKNNDDINKSLADSIARGRLYSSYIAFETNTTVWNTSGTPTTILDFDFFLLEDRAIRIKLFAQTSYPTNVPNRPIFEVHINGSQVQKWWTTLYNGYNGGTWFRNDGYFSYIAPTVPAGSNNITIKAYNETLILTPADNMYHDIIIEDFGAAVTAV